MYKIAVSVPGATETHVSRVGEAKYYIATIFFSVIDSKINAKFLYKRLYKKNLISQDSSL